MTTEVVGKNVFPSAPPVTSKSLGLSPCPDAATQLMLPRCLLPLAAWLSLARRSLRRFGGRESGQGLMNARGRQGQCPAEETAEARSSARHRVTGTHPGPLSGRATPLPAGEGRRWAHLGTPNETISWRLVCNSWPCSFPGARCHGVSLPVMRRSKVTLR
uniref:Uncharacterized protein n=1 Tax=Branchiostoma floridae TaxID=7739 RepID=C3YLX7_BRAFL|eukprot:XP_002602559.1 hypothetical protein BRAFLDRAFT_93864 [Branchiostoma floridae]